MNAFLRKNWAKLSTAAVLGALALGAGAKAYAAWAGDDCCKPGSPCCYPGSPCCHGHKAPPAGQGT
jgi:hypothetical protein